MTKEKIIFKVGGMKENKTSEPVRVQYIPCPDVRIEEDEIDLRDLLRTLNRNKKIILFTTLVFLILASVYIFTKTPLYKTEAYIEIGRRIIVNANANIDIPLLNRSTAIIYINNNYNTVGLPYPTVSAQAKRRTRDIIQITIYSRSNITGKKILDKIVEDLRNRENKRVQSYIESIKNQIKVLENYNKQLLKQIGELKERLNSVKEPQLYQVLLDAIFRCRMEINKNNLEISKLNLKISPANIVRTHIIGKIIQFNHPAKPKKKLIIAVSIVTGLFFGIFLVFFIEFLKGSKESEKE